jgi:hypothetical protein
MTDISSFDLQHLKLIFLNNTMVSSSNCHECAASSVTENGDRLRRKGEKQKKTRVNAVNAFGRMSTGRVLYRT